MGMLGDKTYLCEDVKVGESCWLIVLAKRVAVRCLGKILSTSVLIKDLRAMLCQSFETMHDGKEFPYVKPRCDDIFLRSAKPISDRTVDCDLRHSISSS